MALILNKTNTIIVITTGFTGNYVETGYTETGYTDENYTETGYEVGYGYTKTVYIDSFTDLTYTDEYGNLHENPYLVIDAVIINKLTKFIKITVSIYKNKDSRASLKKSLFERNYNISEQNIYDSYFSVDKMSDVNIFAKSYEYINSIFTDWKSDE